MSRCTEMESGNKSAEGTRVFCFFFGERWVWGGTVTITKRQFGQFMTRNKIHIICFEFP